MEDQLNTTNNDMEQPNQPIQNQAKREAENYYQNQNVGGSQGFGSGKQTAQLIIEAWNKEFESVTKIKVRSEQKIIYKCLCFCPQEYVFTHQVFDQNDREIGRFEERIKIGECCVCGCDCKCNCCDCSDKFVHFPPHAQWTKGQLFQKKTDIKVYKTWFGLCTAQLVSDDQILAESQADNSININPACCCSVVPKYTNFSSSNFDIILGNRLMLTATCDCCTEGIVFDQALSIPDRTIPTYSRNTQTSGTRSISLMNCICCGIWDKIDMDVSQVPNNLKFLVVLSLIKTQYDQNPTMSIRYQVSVDSL